MVFDALIDKLVRLETAHTERQENEVSSLILAAMKLIQYGLRDAISFERGGEVAAQLDRTYSVWMLSLEFFDSKRDIAKAAVDGEIPDSATMISPGEASKYWLKWLEKLDQASQASTQST